MDSFFQELKIDISECHNDRDMLMKMLEEKDNINIKSSESEKSENSSDSDDEDTDNLKNFTQLNQSENGCGGDHNTNDKKYLNEEDAIYKSQVRDRQSLKKENPIENSLSSSKVTPNGSSKTQTGGLISFNSNITNFDKEHRHSLDLHTKKSNLVDNVV